MQTSLIAYKEIQPKIGKMQALVYQCIHNLIEATDNEISAKLHKSISSITPRRNELLQAGLIEDCGTRTCNITGRLAHSWAIIPGANPKPRQKRQICPHCHGKGTLINPEQKNIHKKTN